MMKNSKFLHPDHPEWDVMTQPDTHLACESGEGLHSNRDGLIVENCRSSLDRSTDLSNGETTDKPLGLSEGIHHEVYMDVESRNSDFDRSVLLAPIVDTQVNTPLVIGEPLDSSIQEDGYQDVISVNQYVSSIPEKVGAENLSPYPVTSGTKDSEDPNNLGSSVLTVLQFPQIKDALLSGGKIRFGNRLKGHILDLRGLGDLLSHLSKKPFLRCLQRLLKAGREDRIAAFMYDSSDRWVHRPGLAGNWSDTQYERIGKDRPCGDGSFIRALQLQTLSTKRGSKPSRHNPPVEVDMTFERIKKVRRPKTWKIELKERGRVRVETVVVRRSGSNVAPVEAAWRLLSTKGKNKFVALRLVGPIKNLLNDDQNGWCRSTLCGYKIAVKAFTANHQWEFYPDEGWAIGSPT